MLLVFSLNSFSAFSEDFMMNCDNDIFKLENFFFSKNLLIRSGPKWEEFCDGKNKTLNHFGDGAECIINHEEFDKSKPIFKGKWTYQTFKYTSIIKLDFVLKTYHQKVGEKKEIQIRCRDF